MEGVRELEALGAVVFTTRDDVVAGDPFARPTNTSTTGTTAAETRDAGTSRLDPSSDSGEEKMDRSRALAADGAGFFGSTVAVFVGGWGRASGTVTRWVGRAGR